MGVRFFGRYRRRIFGLFVILFMNWVLVVLVLVLVGG